MFKETWIIFSLKLCLHVHYCTINERPFSSNIFEYDTKSTKNRQKMNKIYGGLQWIKTIERLSKLFNFIRISIFTLICHTITNMLVYNNSCYLFIIDGWLFLSAILAVESIVKLIKMIKENTLSSVFWWPKLPSLRTHHLVRVCLGAVQANWGPSPIA